MIRDGKQPNPAGDGKMLAAGRPLQAGPEATCPLDHPFLTQGHTRSCRRPPSWSRNEARGVGPWTPCSHPTIGDDACVGNDHAQGPEAHLPGICTLEARWELLGDPQKPGSWARPGPQGHTGGTGAPNRPSWCAARAGDRVQPFHFTNEEAVADGLNAD